MKKIYIAPSLKVCEFNLKANVLLSTSNIITTKDGDSDDPWWDEGVDNSEDEFGF